jgi:hypothetical protein
MEPSGGLNTVSLLRAALNAGPEVTCFEITSQ